MICTTFPYWNMVLLLQLIYKHFIWGDISGDTVFPRLYAKRILKFTVRRWIVASVLLCRLICTLVPGFNSSYCDDFACASNAMKFDPLRCQREKKIAWLCIPTLGDVLTLKKIAVLPEDLVLVSPRSALQWQHWYRHEIPARNYFQKVKLFPEKV
jgi:hypothetical protein